MTKSKEREEAEKELEASLVKDKPEFSKEQAVDALKELNLGDLIKETHGRTTRAS